MSQADVLIVGAGLAGLSCALHLQEVGLEVTLFEASDGVGGRVRTDRVDGFRLDRGFQVLLEAYPEARRVLDYDALDLKPFAPGAKVRAGGRFHTVADPLRRPGDLLRTALSGVGSVADKLQILGLRRRVLGPESWEELFEGPDTSTLAALRERGFSERMIDRFFRPFLGGILLDRELATSSHMLDFVFRMLASGPTSVPAGGMGAISEQLAGRLEPGTVRLETRVRGLETGHVILGSGVKVPTRATVLAVDGPRAAELLGGSVEDPGSRGSTALYFAADQGPGGDLEGPWLFLDGEGYGPANSVAFMSSVAPAYAPEGRHLVSVALVGVPEEGDTALERQVKHQLRPWFGAAVDRWRWLRTDRIRHAQPSQPPGWYPRSPGGDPSPRVREGLYACGDWLDTASIQGALLSGRRAAEAVLEDRSP